MKFLLRIATLLTFAFVGMLAYGQDSNPWVPSKSNTSNGGTNSAGTWTPSDSNTGGPHPDIGTWFPSGQGHLSNSGVWVPVEPSVDLTFLEDFFQRTKGSTLIASGIQLVKWGLTTTGVLVADDATVIGVVDDPLILVSGTTTVVGGVILIGGGVYLWIETVMDN